MAKDRSNDYAISNATHASDVERSSCAKRRGKNRKCCIVVTVVLLLAAAAAAVLVLYFVFRDDGDDKDKDGKDTLTYTVTGDVTIDDDTAWPYRSALSNSKSTQFKQYQTKFCNEIMTSYYMGTLDDVSCSVTRFRSDSLVISFDVAVTEPRPDNLTESELSAYKEKKQVQAAVNIVSVFVDDDGDIRNAPAEFISIQGLNLAAVYGTATIDNVAFTQELSDQQSQQYQDLENQFCSEILEGMLEDDMTSHTCNVVKMTPGSVKTFYALTRISVTSIDSDNFINEVEEVVGNSSQFVINLYNVGGTADKLCDWLACEHICDTEPTLQCRCREGFVLDNDQRTCLDIDECAESNGGCEEDCENSEGSFTCRCPTGFLLNSDGISCTDVDECSTRDVGCQQECENTAGSFNCHCFTGFHQTEEGCVDIDECRENVGGCEQVCENSEGSFMCTCFTGFLLNNDGISCTDIDECTKRTHNCLQDCNNTPGSFDCSCFSGFQETQEGCMDIDECVDSNGGCDTVECFNSPGSYRCGCDSGYFACTTGVACIPHSAVCDSVRHCEDWSDEKNCECDDPSTQMRCDLGPCIDAIRWCNGISDCIDGSDEVRECPSGCPNSTFQCYTDFVKFRCVPKDYICDGEADCLGATDEVACPVCGAFMAQCHWGMCINSASLCDGINDCFDWSDEINCVEGCSSDQIRCEAESVRGNAGDFYCVDSQYACDKITDCPSGEDETVLACEQNGSGTTDCITYLEATTDTAYFTSPNYPNNYDNNVQCYWVITAALGYAIELDFISFILEEEYTWIGTTCVDFVAVYEGILDTRLLKRCGIQHNLDVQSYGNVLTIAFFTDESYTFRGFRASYTAFQNNECVSEISAAEPGTLESPGYPSSYGSNLECVWYLTAEEGYQVRLTITDLALHESEDCGDSVAVFDARLTGGDQAVATLISRHCASLEESETLSSTRGVLTVAMITDASASDRGFRATYSQYDGFLYSNCGGEVDVSTSGTISSPEYPDKYSNGLVCVWRFTASPGYNVKLEFSQSATEKCKMSCCDYIEIVEAGQSVWKGCGPEVPAFTAVSSGRYLTLHFVTDISFTYHGFEAHYSQTVGGESTYPDETQSGEVTTTTKSPIEQDCYDNEGYLCSSGVCIQYHKRCDGVLDCVDGSDEQNCDCPSGAFFKCADSKECISISRRCDATADCADHSDEWHCVCPRDKWMCESMARCMPLDWQCDGEVDCEGGQDEQQCGSCASDEYQCSTHECISSSQRCDGIRQCREGSDEAHCLRLLTHGSADNEGIIAVGTENGNLRGVCQQNWNNGWSHVACRQLGYYKAIGYQAVSIGDANGDFIGLITVSTNVSESNIIQGAAFGDMTQCQNIISLSCERIVCGRPVKDPEAVINAGKVVNGDVADIEAWPWMASIHHSSNDGNHNCGASLLNSHWILTAAHCISGENEDYKVHIGSQGADQGAVYDVTAVIIHPNYLANQRAEAAVSLTLIANDIALIKLASAVTFNEDTVMPVCLPHAGLRESHFRRCYVTGWGQVLPENGLGIAARRLRQGKLNFIPHSDCQAFYTNLWGRFPFQMPYKPPVLDTHICAGQTDSHIDACFGDSGGPLNCEDHHGNWYVFGLVSSGPIQDCLRFSLYERVNSHSEWINDVFQQFGDGL